MSVFTEKARSLGRELAEIHHHGMPPGDAAERAKNQKWSRRLDKAVLSLAIATIMLALLGLRGGLHLIRPDIFVVSMTAALMPVIFETSYRITLTKVRNSEFARLSLSFINLICVAGALSFVCIGWWQAYEFHQTIPKIQEFLRELPTINPGTERI